MVPQHLTSSRTYQAACALSPQAAVGARLEADERWSTSSKTYRAQVACEVFGAKMKDICGETGTEGPHPSVVKKRLPRDGGDWDMKACINGRTKTGDAIYKQADKVYSTIINSIVPLFYRLFPDGVLPSGWQNEDAFALIEFNLEKEKEWKKKRKEAADPEEVVDVEKDDEGEEAAETQGSSAEPAGTAADAAEQMDDEETEGDGFSTQVESPTPPLPVENSDDEDPSPPKPPAHDDVDCFEPFAKKSDFERVDPGTYHRKEIAALAWYVYGQLGKNDACFMKQADRTANSTRQDQRKRGEERANKRKEDAQKEEDEEVSELHAQKEREILDIAAKLHHNALTRYYKDADALKTLCKMAFKPAEKMRAYKEYHDFITVNPPPTMEQMISIVKNTSKKQKTSPESAATSSAEDAPDV